MFSIACRWFQAIFVTLAWLVVTSATAQASDRVALVIGNANYDHVPSLETPLNDSAAIARMFVEMGYDTALVQDGSRDEIMLALARLRIRAKDAETVAVYLAGHGFQQNGLSYYFPKDVVVEGEHVFETAISISTIVRAISDKARQKLIFVDACRDTPVKFHNQQQTSSTVPDLSPAGLYVTYSAQPGAPAFDGGGTHSPFAESFLDNARSNEDITAVSRRMRLDVIRATQGQQLPWSQSSLLRPAYLH